MDSSVVLEEEIEGGPSPLRSGGITLYPALALEKIFSWADKEGRRLEWLEGAFFDPTTDTGRLSLSYMCECDGDYGVFKERCLSLAAEIKQEASSIRMGGYFEIGVSPPAQ